MCQSPKPPKSPLNPEPDFTLVADLTAAIRGQGPNPALLSLVGQAFYRNGGYLGTEAGLKRLFDHSLIFLLRLIFTAALIAKREPLKAALNSKGLNAPPNLGALASLMALKDLTRDLPGLKGVYKGRARLIQLGNNLEGADSQGDPILEGSLNSLDFCSNSFGADFLDDWELVALWTGLFQGQEGQDRDWAAFNPASLGRLYEGLMDLEFQFSSPCDQKGQGIEPKLRLSQAPANRKIGGGYYTPLSLAKPLTAQGLELLLARLGQGRSILTLKILDASCGGGRLLLAALDELSSLALRRVKANQEKDLQNLLDHDSRLLTEKRRLWNLDPDLEPIRATIMKRRLLSTCFYGVDLAKVAVAVAKMTLALATDVIGGPALFLDERLKQGDSLLGADLKSWPKFKSENQGDGAGLGARLKATDLKLFHWPVEFPEVFSGSETQGPGGFDLIVANPPWEKTKFEEPLFFAQYQANYRSLSPSQKKEVAQKLLAEPKVAAKYVKAKDRAILVNSLLKDQYPQSGGAGDGNLFRFFVERSLNLLAPGGILSLIAPTGLLTEAGSTLLRRWILTEYKLLTFNGFENRLKVFPAVHGRYKFGLFQIEKPQGSSQGSLKGSLTKAAPPKTRCRFGLKDPNELANDDQVFDYSLKDVVATSPKNWAFLELLGGAVDLAIAKKLYARFPTFNLNWLDFRGELHATADKAIFAEQNEPGYLPLYKGQMIWRYDPKVAKAKAYLDPLVFDAHLKAARVSQLVRDLTKLPLNAARGEKGIKEEKATDLAEILAFLKLKQKSDLGQFVKPERLFPRLAFRAVASDANERTLVASLLPKNVGAQNSLWTSIPGRYVLDRENGTVKYQVAPLERLLFALALFNSLTVDWLLRASMAMNVNKIYLVRLPLPQPTDSELQNKPDYRDLIHRAALLSLYRAPELRADLGRLGVMDQKELIKDEYGFKVNQAWLDVKIASLYGLSVSEFDQIIYSFNVFRNKNKSYIDYISEQANLVL
ncbi:MAG: hypothetical protein LBI10_12530 [Deltaproteobacteria bacterium]|nr:hypothetical protein [Deltaproteobacteria bacterium]